MISELSTQHAVLFYMSAAKAFCLLLVVLFSKEDRKPMPVGERKAWCAYNLATCLLYITLLLWG